MLTEALIITVITLYISSTPNFLKEKCTISGVRQWSIFIVVFCVSHLVEMVKIADVLEELAASSFRVKVTLYQNDNI
jgi:predicted CDP-diglyceride synthetase/phosphatidate cytidylyltransferase